MSSPILLKVGGNEIDDEAFLASFVAVVADLSRHTPLVIVHGGGKEIGDLHQRLGVPFEFIGGQRVTTPASLRLVEMVLSGSVNTRLTRWLVNAGVEALGISGVDLGLLRAEPLRPDGLDLGYVGRIVAARGNVLQQWLAQGITPVVSPVSLGRDGQAYNVNADLAAAALAAAMGVERLVFVSNVPGVLLDGVPVPQLSVAQAEEAIATGQIYGGMIPKVRAALDALATGVTAAMITNLAGLADGSGTLLSHQPLAAPLREKA
ncbi:MAG: acetylglutamate kinase [Caldilineales bacterium]